MSDPHRNYEFRCPIHGFVKLNAWERDIVSHPAFQRLRRIRQLAWTDYVYPGAMHTRFEHSLGVVQVATLLYDAIIQNSQEVLRRSFGYDEAGLKRHRQLVRLAALLHDVGHAPFSHASEDLMPQKRNGDRYEHEDYSAAIIRTVLRDVIESHELNNNYEFKADDIAALREGSSEAKTALLWRDIITGQLDADRMDYLLRDSHHIGVAYGRFDLHRLVNTIRAIRQPDGHGARFGIAEGGWHAAEALVLARYFMFTQVYFHKARVAYDIHLRYAFTEFLGESGVFPRPIENELEDYLKWDDWRVLGMLANGAGGEHGARIAERNHYREAYHTPEIPDENDLKKLNAIRSSLDKLVVAEETAGKSWYKIGKPDIPVVSESQPDQVRPLSEYSSVIGNMKANAQTLLFVRKEDLQVARDRIKQIDREPK